MSKNKFGKDVIVIDSNEDLPEDWHKIDLATMFPERAKNRADGATSDEGTGDEDQPNSSFSDHDNLDSSLQSPNSAEDVKPKRILIFTSIALLSLLSLSRYGSVDGTF